MTEMTDFSDRSDWLSCEALAIGATWAKGWCADMQREHRPVEGGWPGTVDEARALVKDLIHPKLAANGPPTLTEDELLLATRGVYEQAKREWLVAKRTRAARAAARTTGRKAVSRVGPG
jgi:hypothetical protein